VNTKQEGQFPNASLEAFRLNNKKYQQNLLRDGCLYGDEGTSPLVIHFKHVKLF